MVVVVPDCTFVVMYSNPPFLPLFSPFVSPPSASSRFGLSMIRCSEVFLSVDVSIDGEGAEVYIHGVSWSNGRSVVVVVGCRGPRRSWIKGAIWKYISRLGLITR